MRVFVHKSLHHIPPIIKGLYKYVVLVFCGEIERVSSQGILGAHHETRSIIESHVELCICCSFFLSFLLLLSNDSHWLHTGISIDDDEYLSEDYDDE